MPGRATQEVALVERGPEHVSCPSAPRSAPELSHLAWDTQIELLREEEASARPPPLCLLGDAGGHHGEMLTLQGWDRVLVPLLCSRTHR